MDLFYLSRLRKMTLLRGYISFSHFSSLESMLPLKTTLLNLGNFSRTTLQSCLWRSGYSLCPTGCDTQLDSNVAGRGGDELPALSLVMVGVEFLDLTGYCTGRRRRGWAPRCSKWAFCRGAYQRPSSRREGWVQQEEELWCVTRCPVL